MTEKEFSELLERYLDGKASPAERARVEKWYSVISKENPPVPIDEKLRNLYWKQLSSRLRRKQVYLHAPRMAIAAAVALLLMSLVFYFSDSLSGDAFRPERSSAPVEMHVNNGLENQWIMLSDGSEVLLSPGSSLELLTDFNISDRRVALSGEAFFDVSHNAGKPFSVFANEIVTSVLGTSFTITAFPQDKDITVAVKTGSVSVRKNDRTSNLFENETLVLTPNQQAVYSRKVEEVSRMLVPNPEVILSDAEIEKVIRFEGAPVPEIFAALERMFGVAIVFDPNAFTACSLTTSGSGQSLYQTLDIICEAIGATYEVEDVSVRIKGVGCN